MTSRPTSVVDIDGWNDLVELDEHGEGLTTWEVDFVESLVREQVRRGMRGHRSGSDRRAECGERHGARRSAHLECADEPDRALLRRGSGSNDRRR